MKLVIPKRNRKPNAEWLANRKALFAEGCPPLRTSTAMVFSPRRSLRPPASP
jgi:hypothetical protein